jgi:hypothetical protein
MAAVTGKKSKLNIRTRQLILLVLVLIIAAAALVVFLKRDAISDALASRKSSSDYGGEPFSFESGTMQVTAAVGNGLAIASANGLQLLDSGGGTVAHQMFSMDTPAVTSCDTLAAAFDVGGRVICSAGLTGKTTQFSTEEDIINVTMSDGGYLAVCTEAAGYKGRVTVYDDELKAVYQWNSGEGYLLTACVSPDGKYMAALCASEKGGDIHIFSLSSEKEQSSFETPGELMTDMHWLSDNRICALSQTRCIVVDRGGEQKGNYDFGGKYLTDYDFGGDGFAVLMLGKYRTGGTGTLVSVGQDGKLMGEADITSELEAMDANKKYVAVLCQDGVKLFTQSMTQTGTGQNTAGVKDIAARARGDVLLISSAFAEIRSF